MLETRVVLSPYGTPRQKVTSPYTLDQVDALLRLIERPAFSAVELAVEVPVLEDLGWVHEGRLA
ncbi:MAG: hypothetical protein QME94_18060, partial [Anaerolineae bacterium]|nr:hypothetical protein [Anaerolineae bacterium]